MKIILSHPTGNENVRAALSGFEAAHMLGYFYTTIATFDGNVFDRLSSISLFSEFKRRKYHPALRSMTRILPWWELFRQAAQKLHLDNLTLHEEGIFSIDKVYQHLDQHVSNSLKQAKAKGIDSVYGYEDGALLSFRKAKELNIQCFYDLPIGYWKAARKFLEPEKSRWPDWLPTLTGLDDSERKLAVKDEELALADRILVASRFTASTLQEYPAKLAPIHVIPYGFPPVCESRQYAPFSSGRKLKLLFVGGLSQRKGIADIFAAVESFSKYIDLTIVGGKIGNQCPVLDEALSKHTWIPSLPHTAILKLMKENDALLFPSLFEGFGLVITEAMSQGTPVITTERTAGPDLIEHDRNGWLIKAGSTDELRTAIGELLDHPANIEKAGREALDTASKRTWKVYGSELAGIISNGLLEFKK